MKNITKYLIYFERSIGIEPFVRFLLSTLIVTLFSAGSQTAEAMDDIPLGLRNLTLQALQNNDELQSLQDKVSALYEEAPYAGSLENPRLGLGLANVPVDTFDLDQEAMTQKQIFISQKIPWFGKLDLAQQIAELNAMEQHALFRAKQLEIVRRLAQSWYDLDFIEHSLETNYQLEQMVTQLLRVAEVRYSTGKGLQQDILSAQVQLSKIFDERIGLQRNKQLLYTSISKALNSEQPYHRTDPLEPPPEITDAPSREKLTIKALAGNPLLQAKKIAVHKAEAKVKLADKAYNPDMDLRLGYGQREDDPVSGNSRADFFSASVTFSLPLWQSSRQDSKFKAMQKRNSAAQKSLSSLQKIIPHQIDAFVTEITAAQENHILFKTALTLQAEQLAESSLASYSVGKVDFDIMLNARIKTLRYQLQSKKYRYQVLKKMAELKELAGEPSDLLTKLNGSAKAISSKERKE